MVYDYPKTRYSEEMESGVFCSSESYDNRTFLGIR